jgi:hypothetical protein
MECNDLGIMDSDSLGFAISIDLLLALIPITLMLGMVTADMDNIMFQMQDTIFRGSTERVAADTVNTLLTTSGQPVDWENTGNPIVPGLAQYDNIKGMPIEGTISSSKLAALTPSLLQNMIGSDYNYNMTVTSLEDNSTISTIGNNLNGNDIVRIQKDALYAKLQAVYSIVGQIRGSGSIRPYPSGTFATSYNYLQTYNYWIIVNNNGYNPANVTVKIVNNVTNTVTLTSLTNPTQINSNYLKSNQTSPNQFFNNTITVNAGAPPGNSMDLYIVQVPKSVSQNDININNIVAKACKLEFYLWPK